MRPSLALFDLKGTLHLSGSRMLQEFDIAKLCNEFLARLHRKRESLFFAIFFNRVILAATRHSLHLRTVRHPSMNRLVLAHLARTRHARHTAGVGRFDARHEHRFAGDGQDAKKLVTPGFGSQ